LKFAITGGNGFIGQAAVKYATANGHEVRTFDRPEHDILGDLSGLDGADTVIHLAGMLGTAELFETPDLAIDVNVKGTLRVLEWCRENSAGYVGISMPPVFPSVYTATKICADHLARAWGNAYGIRTATVRAFNAFGPGQKHGARHPQKILPTFSVEAWAGRPIPIWGDGRQTVDLVHVDDIGRMLVEAAYVDSPGNVFDAGSGYPVRVRSLADFILQVTGSEAGVKLLPMRKGEVKTHIAAAGAGWRELGWRPAYSPDRIEETVHYYKDLLYVHG
jgi:UDP-glucose 4-epimerase